MPNQAGIEDHNGNNAETLAAGYKNINRRKVHPALFQFLENEKTSGTQLRLLDVGSGAGNDALEMAKLGHQVVAIEPSDLRHIAIRDHAHPNIEYRDDRLPALSSVRSDEPFDVVLLSAVLQYIDPEERVASLRRIAEVMAPGARLFISYPSPPSRDYQYEITPERLQADINAANEGLSEDKKLSIAYEPEITPDSRGRKSLDGRELNFYSFVIGNTQELAMQADYSDKAGLIEKSKQYMAQHAGQVTIDEARLKEVAASFKMPDRLPDWKDYLSTEAQEPEYDITRAAFELAMNASQNAGYTEPDGSGGVKKWEIKGSGSSAIKALFREMRDKKVIPGLDLDLGEVKTKLAPMLEGNVITPDLKGRKVPFAEERLAMFEEFAEPGAMQAIAGIVDNAKRPDGSYHFTFENTVLPLRQHFPKSFGEDPLAKKALLMPILLVANAQAHGVEASTDVPLPADYRLPVTLNKLGILNFGDGLRDAINDNTLFDQEDSRLLAIRGATLIACEELCKEAGFQPQQLDAALWSAATPNKASEQQHDSHVERLLQRPPNSFGLFI